MEHAVTYGAVAWTVLGLFGVAGIITIIVVVLDIIASGYNH